MTALVRLFLAATTVAIGLMMAAPGFTQTGVCVNSARGSCDLPGRTYSAPVYRQPSAAELQEQQSVAFNQRGLAEYNRGNYREAIRLFHSAAQTGTTLSSIRMDWANIGNSYDRLGRAAYEGGDRAEALRLFRLALEYKLKAQRPESELAILRENIGTAQWNLGVVAYQSGNRAEALRQFELALRFDPNGKIASTGQSMASYVANMRNDMNRQAAEQRRQADEQARKAEEQRYAADKKLAVTTSVESLKVSIEASARAREQKHTEVSQLVGELKAWNADKDGEALKLQIRLEAERLAAAPRTQTRHESASAQASAIVKDAEIGKDGCVSDGRANCSSGTSIVFPKPGTGTRGTASLSAKALEAMRKTPALSKLLDDEVRADAVWLKARDNVREKELALTNERDPKKKSLLQTEVSQAVQEAAKAKGAVDYIKFKVEEEGKVFETVELVPDDKPKSPPPPPSPPR